MKWFLPLVWCVCLAADDIPRIQYSKSFPNSVPAFVAITIDRTGVGQYKEAADDDRPLPFQLDPQYTAEIFALVEKLGYLDHSLESPLKVVTGQAEAPSF